MANVNINIIPNDVGQENTPYQVYSQNDLNLIEESLSQSEFDPNDPSNNIELNIYDEGGNLIRSVFPFTDYTVENDSNTNGKVGSLVFDTKAILSSLGLTFGVYRITYRFLKNSLSLLLLLLLLLNLLSLHFLSEFGHSFLVVILLPLPYSHFLIKIIHNK